MRSYYGTPISVTFFYSSSVTVVDSVRSSVLDELVLLPLLQLKTVVIEVAKSVRDGQEEQMRIIKLVDNR